MTVTFQLRRTNGTFAGGVVARTNVTTLPNGHHVSVMPIKTSKEQPLEGRALFEDIFGRHWPVGQLDPYEPQQIVEAARDAGLIGLGGATLPTHTKAMVVSTSPPWLNRRLALIATLSLYA